MSKHPGRADQLVVSLSDIEIGAGGHLDDFPHTAWLGELMAAYNRPPFADIAVDLVFNGDTLDLLKTPVDGAYTVEVDARIALAKLEQVLAAHPDFPLSCRRFLQHEGAPRRIHFVYGNHDLELVFPEVQERLRQAIGHEAVIFQGFEVDFGDLHIEHGSQDDTMFRVDPDKPFVHHQGRQVLAQPWGAQALIEVALPLHHLFYDLDRLKPRRKVMELLPDVRDHMVGAFWQYYTGDFLRGLVSGAPVTGISWDMLSEVAWRFRTADPDVATGGTYRKMLTTGRYRCVVVGHLHSPEWWSWGDRKFLATGCLRDEFGIDGTGNVVAQIPKTYAEIYLRDNQVVRSHLVELDGPPPAPGQVPASVFDVLPRVRGLLESGADVRALAKVAESAVPEADLPPEGTSED